jgi:hypothetical protein
MRRSSLNSLDVAYSREIDSKYDDIKKVADAIATINALAGSDLINITEAEIVQLLTITSAAELINNLTVQAETLDPGSNATVSLVGSVLTIGVPEGEHGVDGLDGRSPKYQITYNEETGNLEVVFEGWDDETPIIEDIV